MPITLFVWRWQPGDPSLERLAGYAELDLHRLVVCPGPMARHDESSTLRRLDEFQPFLEATAT